MKEIELSGKLGAGKKALVDEEDYNKLNNRKWHLGKFGYPASYDPFGDGKRVEMLHRVVLNLQKGELADHIDGNPLNCQKSNLRKCSWRENTRNRTKSKGKSSKYLGVCKRVIRYKDKKYPPTYSSQIMVDDKYIHIGTFKDEEMAAKAYDKKAKELFGDFAKLNFKDE